MKKFFIILLIVAVAGCLNAQNYVFIGLAPMYNFQNRTNDLQSVLNSMPENYRPYDSDQYTLSNAMGGILSLGYRGYLGKGFYLGGSAEFGITRWGLYKNEDIKQDATVVSIGFMLNAQKVFELNNRLNLFTGATLGFNYLPKTDNVIIRDNTYPTPNTFIDQNGDLVTKTMGDANVKFSAYDYLNTNVRPTVGMQYKLLNGARLELGITYNIAVERLMSIYYGFSETTQNISQGTTENTYYSGYTSDFGLNSFLAEVKYCIPLVDRKSVV